jgi:RNA polymerase sigma-70 factor (ECF subfamily)
MSSPCPACVRAESSRIAELVRAHREALLRVARAEGLSGEDALDAVQEAFTAFVTRPPVPRERARRTLAALTRNLARNGRRLHRNARPHVTDDATLDALDAEAPEAEAQLVAAEEKARLDCCVARLADLQRAVVTLRVLEECSGADVAERLGLSAGHVAVLLHRAKSALAACLSEEA